MLNFKKFIEAYLNQDAKQSDVETPDRPDTLLDFETVSTTGSVVECRVVGKNYRIQLDGEATVFIECNKFHRMFGKNLPKRGDIVTAVWYKYKEGKNYTLKSMRFSHAS